MKEEVKELEASGDTEKQQLEVQLAEAAKESEKLGEEYLILEEVEKYLTSLHPPDHIAKIKEVVSIDLDILVKRYLNSLILKDKNIEEQQQIISALETEVKSQFRDDLPKIDSIEETLRQINLLSTHLSKDDAQSNGLLTNELINDFIIIPVFVLNEILHFDLQQTKIDDTMCPPNLQILEEVLANHR